jgi:hypothetical protein
MERFLKWMVYGPNYHENKSLLREAVRRREASQCRAVREDPKLKSLERKMAITNIFILWTWRFTTAMAVVGIVLISLAI